MKVSLVMAVYNGEEFLKEALDAAFFQTYSDLEIIVVNDGSTDSTKALLEAVYNSKVKVINIKRNQGAANALNTGISHAKGEWIAIQDADDISLPTRIEEQVNYIKNNPHLIGLGTLIECIAGSPNISENRLKGTANYKNSYLTYDEIRKEIYYACTFTHSSMMFSKNVFLEVGGYSTDFNIAYDYDLWLKFLEKGDMEIMPMVLLQYRIRNDSLAHRSAFATISEKQLASSRAIYRSLCKVKSLLEVIVIGPKYSCENYRDNIVPYSKLHVTCLAYENRDYEVEAAVKQFKRGEADVIIVLSEGYIKETIVHYLMKNSLVLNKHFFALYNLNF